MKSQQLQTSSEWLLKSRSLRDKLKLADAEALTKMNTLVSGLKFQRLKANNAVQKVNQLKGALLEYEKVNIQPTFSDIKIQFDPVETTDMKTNLNSFGLEPLPDIRLDSKLTLEIADSVTEPFVSKAQVTLRSEQLTGSENAELANAREWFTTQQAVAMGEFISNDKIAIERSKIAAVIKKERQRIVQFMANVRARYNRFKEAFTLGRISTEKLQKVEDWARARDMQARVSFEEFRTKYTAQLVLYLNKNKQIQEKLAK